MRKHLTFTFLLVQCCLSGCSSTRGYFLNRGRDALDTVTATVGIGAGIQARVGPLPLGLLQNSDAAGVRYGDVFCRAPAT